MLVWALGGGVGAGVAVWVGASSGVGAGVNFALGGVGVGVACGWWVPEWAVGLGLVWALRTHPSATAFSSASLMPSRTCAPTAIMSKITPTWPFAARPEFVNTKISVAT